MQYSVLYQVKPGDFSCSDSHGLSSFFSFSLHSFIVAFFFNLTFLRIPFSRWYAPPPSILMCNSRDDCCRPESLQTWSYLRLEARKTSVCCLCRDDIETRTTTESPSTKTSSMAWYGHEWRPHPANYRIDLAKRIPVRFGAFLKRIGTESIGRSYTAQGWREMLMLRMKGLAKLDRRSGVSSRRIYPTPPPRRWANRSRWMGTIT